MRILRVPFIATLIAGFFTLAFLGCKKDLSTPTLTSNAKVVSGGNCTGYLVDLAVDNTTSPGYTVFTWTITNPNPGNGSGTTIQNLGHWDFIPGTCLDQNWQDVVAASYRYGTTGDFTPVPVTGQLINDIRPDQSLVNSNCYTGDVFKFDQGTTGSTPTQYRLVLKGNWGTADLNVWFKSGNNTGCCANTYTNMGVGCPITEECSFSQGYWFANNEAHPNGVHPWPNDITVGGKIYTNAEGLAISNVSNKLGITDAKRAFTQLASLRLSGIDITDPAIASYVTTIDTWLSHIAKLSGTTPVYLPNQSPADAVTYGNAGTAASVIGAWITANECK